VVVEAADAEPSISQVPEGPAPGALVRLLAGPAAGFTGRARQVAEGYAVVDVLVWGKGLALRAPVTELTRSRRCRGTVRPAGAVISGNPRAEVVMDTNAPRSWGANGIAWVAALLPVGVPLATWLLLPEAARPTRWHLLTVVVALLWVESEMLPQWLAVDEPWARTPPDDGADPCASRAEDASARARSREDSQEGSGATARGAGGHTKT
jgi:hypothetical protein